jgi:alkylhydroperoxidase/carboxymuconolactone decarboxylase family protein YurZ
MTGDDRWYEAAFVVGITNALNVVADGLAAAAMRPVEPTTSTSDVREVFTDIRAFYGSTGAGGGEIPTPFALIAHDPAYLADVWAAVKHAFTERRLTRRHKTALAFAVSLTTRSAFGTAFHLGELRRLGVGERGVMEIIGVTQMFSSYTKIADTLQLHSDMADIAPVDRSGVPDAGTG